MFLDLTTTSILSETARNGEKKKKTVTVSLSYFAMLLANSFITHYCHHLAGISYYKNKLFKNLTFKLDICIKN